VRSGRDDGGVVQWLGRTPEDDPALYEAADVRRRLPAATQHVLVHGSADRTVDIAQSREHAAEVRGSGDPCELIEIPDEGHYAFLDPREPACRVLYDVLGSWRRGESPLRSTSTSHTPGRPSPGSPLLEER
jgi:acetyl esterase/lipase